MKKIILLIFLFVFVDIFGGNYLFTKRTNNYLRKGAGAYHELIKVLPANQKIEVIDKKGKWLKVQLPDGTTGWIAKNSVTAQAKKKDYKKMLSKTWSSANASKSGLAAAIKGLKGKSGKTSAGNVDKLLRLSQTPFTEMEFRRFKSELEKVKSRNVGKVDFDDLDLADIEYDPDISEMRAGMGIASRFMNDTIITDENINKYVNLIAATLLSKSPFYDYDFHVFVMNKNTVDGYACPGGYIFITTGAILSCKNEAQLAGLIGHELAHVVRKHGLQEMSKRRVQIKSDDVFAELDSETGDRNDEVEDDLDEMILAGYERVMHTRLLSYELEADKISSVLCANAGYDPFQFGRVIKRLADAYQGTKDIFDNSYLAPNDMKRRSEKLNEFLEDNFEHGNSGAYFSKRFNRYVASLTR